MRNSQILTGLVWTALVIHPARGQDLLMSSPSVSRGKAASVSISLVAPRNSQPAALQWDLIFPAAEIHIQDRDWAATEAAIKAGKSLSCVRQLKRQPEGFLYKCILAGGEKPIPNGPVATLKVVAVDSAGLGKRILRLENVLAVSARAKQQSIRPTETTVTVH